MTTMAIDKGAPTRKVKHGSMSRDRAWALRWSYFFLTLFAIRYSHFSRCVTFCNTVSKATGDFPCDKIFFGEAEILSIKKGEFFQITPFRAYRYSYRLA